MAFLILVLPLLLAAPPVHASHVTADSPLADDSQRSGDALLTAALEVVSSPGACGRPVSSLSAERMLYNSTPPLVIPFLQAARDACQLLSFLPSLSDRNMSPSVLGIMWRTLMSRVQKPPLGVAYFEAREGSMALLLPLKYVDINQCDDSQSEFAGSHKCDSTTTECVFQHGMGFRSGGYECRCLQGFFNPDAEGDWTGFSGKEAELEPRACLPCPEECGDCAGGAARCMARHNLNVRGALLAVQSLCMGITVGLAFIVFRSRKRKVVVRFFQPSVEFCLIETWCRELGFVVCYGSIILKLYRILIEFRTRKAHRWVVRDKDLLKYLLAMVIIAVGYLSAHTATALHTMQGNPDALMAQGRTLEGIRFPTCRVLWWDFVTQTGEIGMLLFGIHLSIASRNATTQFQERRFLYLALIVEGIVSGLFYVLRGLVWPHLHPDIAFVAYVIRSQLSNTIVLLLLFLPKVNEYKLFCTQGDENKCLFQWWYCRQGGQQRPSPGRLQPGPLLSEGLTPSSPAIGGADAEFPEISLADMNPEDIRAELKRLYTQLEVLKNKTIRANNPHISKRRGGRKVAHRRFSLQALHHRQKSSRHHSSHHDHDAEGEVSRTPEDSVCSVEGPSAIFNDGPSVAYSELGYPASRKILIEFRTRKAHRWVVRDKDLLKYLLAMVIIAVGYLSAHTATALHTMQGNPDALMAQGRTLEGIRFPTCRVLWWDFVTQTGEIGMLLFGIHLSIASRNATTQFQERRFLYLALIVEGIVSGLFYVLRGLVWPHLHPDIAFVAYVIRSQLSNTIVLLLLFLPKVNEYKLFCTQGDENKCLFQWWYCRQGGQQRPSPGRLQPGPLLSEGLTPSSPAIGGADAEFPEISLADMNPEDIRAELKRLYTQLEVLKNKTIRANNPHISKRRGGRKVAHRRFSLQALHHRQKSSRHHSSHHDHDAEGEVSRTPEDSVCSVEGPSAIFNDGPSVAYSELGYPASRK
ncbi:hypothetical protein B566_EDAN014847 [Ephemera danica]|nr:hypothetical protein B566_EDAN014847 [Ephemera danica]